MGGNVRGWQGVVEEFGEFGSVEVVPNIGGLQLWDRPAT
jgi:hypothetical protein